MRQILILALILGSFIGFALVFRIFLDRVVKKLVQKTRTGLDDAIISALQKPATVSIILMGVYLSVQYLPLGPVIRSYFSKGLSAVFSLLGIYSMVALADAVIKWYRSEVVLEREETGLSSRILGLFRIIMLMLAAPLAVLTALDIWGVGSARLTAWIEEHGWRIALILALSIIFIVAIGELIPKLMVRTLARRAGESEEEAGKRADTLSRVLVGAGQVIVLLIGIFIVLSELKINITSLLAGAGVAGIAIGFGAQSLVKNLIAGLFIIMENQYRIGDVIRIAGVAGLVEDISLRRTILRDLDGVVHVVPNGEIQVASNFTREYSRVNFNISVAYGTDLEQAIAVINRVGKELAEDPKWAPSILTPPQVLRVDNLSDSGIEIKILGDTKPICQWNVMGELRLRLKKAFDERGIEIPWPHIKVYFGMSPNLWHNQSNPGGKHS